LDHIANVELSEIEITPEMIEAGVGELLGHDIYMSPAYGGPSMEVWREAIKDAFSAMLRVRLESRG
jgi:hypothetical protein